MLAMTAEVMAFPPFLQAPGTEEADFEPLADLAALPEGSMLRVSRGDLDLLLVHSERGICATEDRCPHMAAPLSLGALDGCLLACPLHSGRFDLLTGNVAQFPTTGGLDADGNYHPPWAPPGTPPRAEASDIKARARAATRVRRLRYYPLRVSGTTIEVALPAQRETEAAGGYSRRG